ncbi:DUF5367 family protein [Aurantibacter sp.]|uniref:DUF5367 family protein n=1 Tax=Aurantibacter sp. TaxID=2807103 RepID=UPI0032656279
MKNILFSVLCGIIIWILGVTFYVGSFYVPLLENPEQQANIVLAIGIIPSVLLGTYIFYSKGKMKPAKLALTFIGVAVSLDVLITVPVFIIPTGSNYSEFFQNPMFYTIIVEFYFMALFYGNHLIQKRKI